jgi:hypothetical protein
MRDHLQHDALELQRHEVQPERLARLNRSRLTVSACRDASAPFSVVGVQDHRRLGGMVWSRAMAARSFSVKCTGCSGFVYSSTIAVFTAHLTMLACWSRHKVTRGSPLIIFVRIGAVSASSFAIQLLLQPFAHPPHDELRLRSRSLRDDILVALALQGMRATWRIELLKPPPPYMFTSEVEASTEHASSGHPAMVGG